MNANRLLKADQRFHEPIEAAAADEPIVISPADKSDHHLLRVLIVDDHRSTAKTLSSLVTIWGHNVRAVDRLSVEREECITDDAERLSREI